MKKLLFSLLGLVIALIGVWLGASWWIGKQTESFVREQLSKASENSVLPANFKQEIVSYERSLFHSKAVTKFVTDQPILKDLVQDIQLNHTIQHGPLLLGNGLSVGTSQWTTTLDTAKLPEPQQAWIKEAFANKEPGSLKTNVGFGGNAQYHFQLNPLASKAESGATFKIAKVEASGSVKPKGEMSPGTFNLSGLEVKDNAVTFTVPEIKAEGQSDVHSELGVGKVDLKAPNIQILTAGATQPITLDLAMNTDIHEKEKSLEGNINLGASNIQGPGAEVKNASLKLDYTGFNTDGLLEMKKLQEKLQNLQSQMLWNMDETEVPEGRQNMAQLQVEAQELGTKMLETLFAKVLKANESRLKYVIDVELQKGKVNGVADLTYAGAATPPTLTDMMTYQVNDWGKLVRGTVDLTADKAALPAGSEMMFAYALEKKGVVDAGNQYKVSLKLLGEQAEVNGQAIPFAEIPAQFMPQMPSSPALGTEDNGLGLPPDIMKQIEEKGVTPEIMQQIEESDDISPETIELLKQLQNMPKEQGEASKDEEPKAE
ncbi:DUF945 family protein [Thiolinea disciformis]|uniref:DUF945 family protein n=1 Tax=Thiolinea disciformis TaxID=125614 RepID=UPI00037219D6|nr:DUF945 family protein [Thiolinea disciformis]